METRRSEHVIERLGHRGDGVAAGPVYVPRALPGEVVNGILDDQTLRDVRISTPSPDRVRAPCPHDRACGGCQLQHARDDFVARWKIETVVQALAAQGLSAPMRPIKTSPPRSRRRAVLAARRVRGGALVGMHGRASDAIVEIPECHLLRPALVAALPLVRALAIAGASRKAALDVALTESRGGLDVAVGGGKAPDAALRAHLAQVAEAHDVARLTWGEETLALRRPPEQVFGAACVVPPPGAFLQATAEGEAALLAAVAEIVSDSKRRIDLFSGCGTFALPLAAGAQMLAVEGDGAMIDALDRARRTTPGLAHVRTETRDLFRRPLIAAELSGFDAAIIDPPRAGAAAQTAELAASGIPVIAAVSCNPATFSRDAACLVAAGYRLDWVQVVDQFRWSSHVELAASFTLSHIRDG